MRLVESGQCDVLDIAEDEVDLILGASGFETRAIHVPNQLRTLNAGKRIALGFKDRRVLARTTNDEWFARNGYICVEADGNSDSAVRSVLETVLHAADRPVRIVVDYTSMTRVWYAGVLSFIRTLARRYSVDVFFTYAPSKYAQPRPAKPNAHMGPVPGFSGLDLPNRRSALLIGLGYERGRALGLAEYVQAAETFAFYADPALDPAFVEIVEKNNAALLEMLGSERVFTYPLSDLRSTAARIGSLALGLSGRSYRVILAPLGPKPFGLLCFLLATQHPRFDVWRVSAGVGGRLYDREPAGPILVSRARFGE